MSHFSQFMHSWDTSLLLYAWVALLLLLLLLLPCSIPLYRYTLFFLTLLLFFHLYNSYWIAGLFLHVVIRNVWVQAIVWACFHFSWVKLSRSRIAEPYKASQVALVVKNPSADAGHSGSRSQSARSSGVGTSNPLSILAWKIPWRGVMASYSPWGPRVEYDWATEHTHTYMVICVS